MENEKKIIELISNLLEVVKNNQKYSQSWISYFQKEVSKLRMLNPETYQIDNEITDFGIEDDLTEMDFKILSEEEALENLKNRIEALKKRSKTVELHEFFAADDISNIIGKKITNVSDVGENCSVDIIDIEMVDEKTNKKQYINLMSDGTYYVSKELEVM